jgi:hypothetical protein
MKSLLKAEEAAMTVVALYALSFHTLGMPVWLWALLFFMPDISMLGYVANVRLGAFLYNLFHHKGIAILLAATGYFANVELLLSTGILLFAHASFDRIWGYGLKYTTGFKDTHLGSLEKRKVEPTLI